MLDRFKSDNSNWKILHGSDTDVSYVTIVRMHQDQYVMTSIFADDENGRTYSKSTDMSYDELHEHFHMQSGSPMDYISREDFEWITTE